MSGNASQKDDPQLQSQNLEIRTALSDAYAAVEGFKAAQSFSALTFEDLADQQIERLEGADTEARPNERRRIQRVLNNVLQAVAKVKAMPPEAFAKADPSRDVNTPP